MFSSPLPFAEALALASGRGVLPLGLDSSEYRALSADLRRRSMFAANLEILEVLQKLSSGLARIAGGVADEAGRAAGENPLLLDPAQLRLETRQLLDLASYAPKPEDEGTIKDLRTDARLNLIIDTNIQTAQGYGQWKGSMNDATLDVFPAWELFRLVAPITGKERNWQQRWRMAGGFLVGGRMVALKTDEIWQRLGSTEIFDDGLDNPYPPFAFNSGMDVRDIGRAEAIELGLMTEDSPPQTPQDLGINDSLEASADKFDQALQDALLSNSEFELVDGVLRLKGGA